MNTPQTVEQLKKTALECRIEILKMLETAKSGHPGGSLSVIDMVTALYFNEMKWDPKSPHWADRDRFVLSKGHGVSAVYAALAIAGAIPKEELSTLRRTNSRL